MKAVTKLRTSTWILTVAVVIVSIVAWFPTATPFTSYSLFPIFGLVAFGLMWTHYVSGAIRSYLELPAESLRWHFRLTSSIVLISILLHPLLLETQLYRDGFGLPPLNVFSLYGTAIERLALVAAIAALLIFLMFETYRRYATRSWWRYVEWANVAAMILILAHGFVLGTQLRIPWFQLVWLIYAATFIIAVAYTEYYKRRRPHGKRRHT